jgi:hypothetical protein
MSGKRPQAKLVKVSGMNCILFTAFFIFVSSIVAYGQRGTNAVLRGSVKSTDGKPIAGVAVFFSIGNIVKTDEKGTFEISFFRSQMLGNVISFRLSGYKPISKILDAKTETLEVILEHAAGSNWAVSQCTEKENLEKRKGFWAKYLWFRLPEDVMHKESKDVDYKEDFFIYGAKDKRERLVMMEGHFASSGKPLDRLYLSSKEFDERLVKVGNAEWLDVRGKTSDGKRWRWVGGISFVSYEDVSDEAAAYFDKVIDSVCWKERKFKQR